MFSLGYPFFSPSYLCICRSAVPAIFAVIHFVMENTAACFTFLHDYYSWKSWAVIIHWSVLTPKALRVSHTLFPLFPPPRGFRTSHLFRQYYILYTCRETPRTEAASCLTLLELDMVQQKMKYGSKRVNVASMTLSFPVFTMVCVEVENWKACTLILLPFIRWYTGRRDCGGLDAAHRDKKRWAPTLKKVSIYTFRRP